MKTINWGIIGLGKIANSFAKDLLTVEGCKLYAVASRSIEKAEEFSKTYNAIAHYGSYEELAKDPNVDVIYIATPHVKHYQDTIMCLNHQKAVLCEKPFAMNAKQVEEMISTAKANNCFLMEALWTRMMPHFIFVLEELKSGKYGSIKSLKADFCFEAPFNPKGRLFDKTLGGGALLDVGIYPVFCALAILGKPDEIVAQTKIGETGIDNETSINLKYKGDVIADLNCSIVYKTGSTATIICENGSITLESRFHETDRVTTELDGVKTSHDFKYKAKGYNFEIAHVAQLLREDLTESPLMTFEFSQLIIETLDTIREKIALRYD